MFDILNKYKTEGNFFFRPTDSLEEVCNAPDNKNGVYTVYQLKDGHVDMVYIGASGTRFSNCCGGSLCLLRQVS